MQKCLSVYFSVTANLLNCCVMPLLLPIIVRTKGSGEKLPAYTIKHLSTN